MKKAVEKGLIDVVIVGYRSQADLPRLLDDLGKMGRRPQTIHYADNTGNPRTLTIAWNDLGAQGNGEFLAFFNTDIRISPDWDERLTAALEADPAVGAVLPKPVGHDWPALVAPGAPHFPRNLPCPPPAVEHMRTIADRLKEDGGIYSFGGECNASFYAVLVRRATWEALKGFDERYRFYGQDHDFQRRMLARLGLSTVIVNRSPFWHQCAGSTGEAAKRGEVDFQREMIHHGEMKGAITSGRMKEWDLLDDSERAGVRSNPAYNRMPTFKNR